MKKTSYVLVALALAGVLAIPAAAEPTAFMRIAGHYEAIRQALLHDTLDGVAAHARDLAKETETLQERFDPGAAGVDGGQTGACQRLLPEIGDAAKKLASAEDLSGARTAFGELSKPMVRYREMAGGDRPIVVFCPMAKKSWLQPEGEVGNPYYGQKMARCGEVVSR